MKTIIIEDVLEELNKKFKGLIESTFEDHKIIIYQKSNAIHWAQKKLIKDVQVANEAMELFVNLFPGKNKTEELFKNEVLPFFEKGNLLESSLRKQLLVHLKVNTSGMKIEKFIELYEFKASDEDLIDKLKQLKVFAVGDKVVFDPTTKSFEVPPSLLKSIVEENTIYIEDKEELNEFVEIFLFKELINGFKRYENFPINPIRNALPYYLGERLKPSVDTYKPLLELDWAKLKKNRTGENDIVIEFQN